MHDLVMRQALARLSWAQKPHTGDLILIDEEAVMSPKVKRLSMFDTATSPARWRFDV